MLFSLITVLWVSIRLPEPLTVENRRPFSFAKITSGMGEMWRIPAVRISILVQSLIFGSLFGMISSVQQVYDLTYDRGDQFPLWFAGVALISGSASLLNARLVMRLGMRYLITAATGAQIVLAASMALAVTLLPVSDIQFYVFALWQTAVFFSVGMTLGNLNALAMEPLGHMAGTGASIMGAIATILGAAIAAPIGLAFDGTALPLALALLVLSTLSFLLMLRMRTVEAIA